ncbi:MAG: lysophospholipid acyltransferase family protein [Ancalomicrobiaceae bacterium]|nr:lysophospholipid acyltransferase family protein [Ancalomicrobiaceae bacterium]
MRQLLVALTILWLVAVTLAVLPVQMLAAGADWPLARQLPVWWHGFVLRRLGVRVTEAGGPANDRPLLITANHISWLDISVLASRTSLSFVAKSEVASWPIFGLFARLQRCIFVDRQRRTATGATTREIGDRLKAGDAIVLFPEGTSGDGNGILPFRSALLGAARAAIGEGEGTVWVQPVAIRYRRLQGLPIGRFERPRLAWYGNMDLIPHLLAAFSLVAVDVDVIWGEPIATTDASDRKTLAATLERCVTRLYSGDEAA